MSGNHNQPSSSNDDKNLASAQHGSSLGNRKTLKLLECNKLKNLVSSLVSFRSLMTLEVSRCHELENLVTPSIANSMEQLKRMTIIDCKNIKEIIEGREAEGKIEFKQLKSLRLQWLPSLERFCSGSYSNFPQMDELIVKECPKLETFSDGVIDIPLLKKVCRTGYDKGCPTVNCGLNAAIKTLNVEKRDTLEELGSLRWNLGKLWEPLSAEGT
ncbi:hypothetical protein SLEP1_g25680 [Rubroshorea leprosula]|uniref:Disease resistance protein At4g27190-like leucine-rich repeats domain-containing protein n=1 Tax=Rubroshorea leprosula TaxID=152421 RepID=A0AAV5JJM2_9ROSI|nr:hypothetical protein SLEP1_g25680 [Rubroshorea leprosula]